MTLLFRLPNQPGLEILTEDDRWASVPLNPDRSATADDDLPILVNLGDVLSFWTNGLLKSTVHRVTIPTSSQSGVRGEDRYSIAYFCHPDDDAKLTEVPSPKVPKSSVSNGAADIWTAKDHLNSRLAATYG